MPPTRRMVEGFLRRKDFAWESPLESNPPPPPPPPPPPEWGAPFMTKSPTYCNIVLINNVAMTISICINVCNQSQCSRISNSRAKTASSTNLRPALTRRKKQVQVNYKLIVFLLRKHILRRLTY